MSAMSTRSVKELASSYPRQQHFSTIPSSYNHKTNYSEAAAASADDDTSPPIPTIDFSLLMSDDPKQRSNVISELGDACRDWGFFLLVNHGIPEDLIKAMIDGIEGFFDLPPEDRAEYEGKHVLDPIRYGTSFNASVEKVHFWRDYLKVFVHPEFHFPSKPQGFSEVGFEYCKKMRGVAKAIIEGIFQSLGLEESYMNKELDMDNSSFQTFIANLYPPCPQPELAMGMPPHSDHGLLTLLAQNQVGGLQIQHKGKWVPVNGTPISSFLVNTGDHLEIISNGRYKSNIHRAVVNNKTTRISVAVAGGPSLDAVVRPAPALLHPSCAGPGCPAYKPMKYRHYLELQQSNQLDGKSCLDRIRMS